MMVEYIRYKLAPDQQASFEAAYEEALTHLQASPHCLACELSRCVEEPQYYVLRLTWDSLDGHLQGFRRSEVFPRFLKPVRPYVSAIEEMRHYEVTKVCWKRE